MHGCTAGKCAISEIFDRLLLEMRHIDAAKGMKATGAVMWYGMSEIPETETILATGAKTAKIIKPYVDKGDIIREMEHATGCGEDGPRLPAL
jgi:hypothetical protein